MTIAHYALFCVNPLDPRSVEPDFGPDAQAAKDAGLTLALLDHDELDRRMDATAATRKTRLNGPGLAVYRGWMLRSEAYDALFNRLLERGVRMLTSPAEYTACHHTPGSYEQLKKWMPQTMWVPNERLGDARSVRDALDTFGSSPVIVKDWVKSQASGYWDEACYIPNAADGQAVSRVVSRFLALQGDSFTGGLVFKRYVPLMPAGAPALEYRAFIAGGRTIGCWPRSDDARKVPPPPSDLLDAVAAQIPSPFASADFGKDADGNWWLLEVGDGQVSGLPAPEVAAPLMDALENLLRSF